MNIVYASDNGFAEYLGISMLSLFESNKECEEITVYVLDDGISDDNRGYIESITKSYSRSVFFIDVRGIAVPPEVESERWSKSAFTRLYLRELLSGDIKKVLYLDCDIIINSSVEEFYNTELDNCYCAGVRDCVSRHYLRNLDIKDEGVYFNSGVLLINLERWNIDEFMSFFRSHKEILKYPDQDVINGVCCENVIIADLKYNCYTAMFDFSYKDLMIFRKPSVYYTEEEVRKAKEAPSIVHFTTSFLSLRPWIEGCQHEYADKWIEYKMKSPWADDPLKKDNRCAKKKLALKIYKAMPSFISVRIAGFLHSKLVPIMRRK